MLTSGNMVHAVKVRDKTIDMKETKDLFGRLIVLSRSNRDHILRLHVQARVVCQTSTQQQVSLDPVQYGYYKGDDGRLKPTANGDPPAPKVIIEMMR
ncbi:hypothetical protein E2C01_052343 [Portunus trituberculatus]|uniref:Uncharacterized protein n=1 Tax=Portunus trituberculatus TaxID=210409 RepID=A0A5B7GP43_PORTR|nr:hypothetical protein [Portunus trituberculatus]